MKAAISALVLLAVLGSAVAASDESRAHMRRLLNTDANVGARTFKVGAADPTKVKDPASVDTSKLAFARLEKATLIPQTPKRLLLNTDANVGARTFKVGAADPTKVKDPATADTSKLAFARLEKAEASPAPKKAAVVSKTPAKPKHM